MPQINLGKRSGIDTDDVSFWCEVKKEDGELVTQILFKGTAPGEKVAQLHGDVKEAFDAWAESLRPVPAPGLRELCATCGWRNVNGECKHATEGATYPECYEDEEA